MSRPCRECRREIPFAKSAKTGKMIPLEAVQSYEVDDEGVAHAAPMKVFISHFKTCPGASKFSGGKYREGLSR